MWRWLLKAFVFLSNLKIEEHKKETMSAASWMVFLHLGRRELETGVLLKSFDP